MLTKENYIQYRKTFTDRVTPEMLYEYYLDHNETERNRVRYGNTLEMGATQFEHYFASFINSLSPLVKSHIINRILTHFDKKFNVVSIRDAEGNILKHCINGEHKDKGSQTVPSGSDQTVGERA